MAAAVVLLGCMTAWTWLRETDRVGPRAPIRDPATSDGVTVTLSLYDVVAVPDATHLVLARTGEVFRVETDARHHVGECLTVQGTWRAADEVLVASWVEPHPERGEKGGLGMAAIAFLVVATPFWFRVEGRRVVARA